MINIAGIDCELDRLKDLKDNICFVLESLLKHRDNICTVNVSKEVTPNNTGKSQDDYIQLESRIYDFIAGNNDYINFELYPRCSQPVPGSSLLTPYNK